MSTLKILKEYLVGDDGYLLNEDNDGKTVMLSGAWGTGKTHFWQNEIEGELTKQLNSNNKACVYVSLYGKDNIEAIKNEILFKAYESIKDENKIAKRAISAFGFASRLLSVSYAGVRVNTGEVEEVVENFFESKKINEAESFLADGGLICLDDFERKSKHIDLNDLFGFIAQLAIDMNCKVVIILNSDVFEGEEANVFKTVKEKTVNKFFYFEPTVEELFNSIYNSDKKYKKLDEFKDEILHAIKETEELNARIYIQVLDNCLEWVEKGYKRSVLRHMTLRTIFFVKHHFTLTAIDRRTVEKNKRYDVIIRKFQNKGFKQIANILQRRGNFDRNSINRDGVIAEVYKLLYEGRKGQNSEDFDKRQNEIINENSELIYDFVKYIHVLNADNMQVYGIDIQMDNFIKSGILTKSGS